jgi:uncharacterized protein YbaP (TraB family)
MIMTKELVKEIQEDLKRMKRKKFWITENQLIATACAVQDQKGDGFIDFKTVESIYNDIKEKI